MSTHSDFRLYYPATERNRDFITPVLQEYLPKSGRVLEIASGSGEHMCHFAHHLPNLSWQPSDIEAEALKSITAWRDHYGIQSIADPILFDVHQPPTGLNPFEAIMCINMIHISPWSATEGLFSAVDSFLKTDGILYLYGPYKVNNTHTAPSNEAFDGRLKEMNPAFGIRDLEVVTTLAAEKGLKCLKVLDMPANNLSVIFQRTTSHEQTT